MQGYESRTQPRELYEKVREYMPGGHFWMLESPKEMTEAIRLLLSM
jgi:hypothetical protein